MNSEWLKCGEVLGAVQRNYTGRHAEQDAKGGLLKRLAAGTMSARGNVIVMDGSIWGAPLGIARPQQAVPIPVGFWSAVEQHTAIFPSHTARYHGDWAVGDFELQSLNIESCESGYFKAVVQDVHLHRVGIPELGPISHEVKPSTKSGGRPAASWWPDFAEELAIYVHDSGTPAGEGTEGQNKVIDAILKRLAKRGKNEPSRTTIQPVINAVLKRLREAGN